ncbi:MAG: hypothetical protein R3B82_06690 [Sandaracinaceae bacterium]
MLLAEVRWSLRVADEPPEPRPVRARPFEQVYVAYADATRRWPRR